MTVQDPDKQNSIKKIQLIVADSLAIDPDSIAADSRLVAQLGADSLDFTDIMFQLESEFNIALQKENFNFLQQAGVDMDQLELANDLDYTTKQRLQQWLPGLPLDQVVRPQDLSQYITIETLYCVVAHASSKTMQTSEKEASR